MKLKQVVLFYYYIFILLNVIVGMVFGYVTRDVIQPGLFIHGGILLLLVWYFLNNRRRGGIGNMITKIIIGFTLVFSLNFFVIEIYQLNVNSIYPSLNYAFKIYLLLFLAYFTVNHYEYFKKRANSILLVNTIIVLLNIILGYYFKIGGQSYDRLFEDSYRGFLAANDTSMFSFVAFGFSLYSLDNSRGRKRYIVILLLIGSLLSMYIIATKAIIVSGIILAIYLYHKKKMASIVVFAVLAGLIFIIIIGKGTSPILERLFKNYNVSMAQSDRMLEQMKNLPEYIKFLSIVAPGRIVIGISMLITLLKGSIINILFGYGVSGIYETFGRPPMMDFFNIMGYFGLLGFVVFYIPQLKIFLKIIKFRKFEMIEVLFLAILLYGSLGGFLFGVADTSIMYSLVFSLTYVNLTKYKRIK